jgi:hypothetical protein
VRIADKNRAIVSHINTSEVSINVVTGVHNGRPGLECLRRAFLQPDPTREAGHGTAHPARSLHAIPHLMMARHV